MPQHGDKLYKFWNGRIETVHFLRENVAEGASIPTWIVRNKDNSLSRVSQNMYSLSEKEAILRELPEYEQSLSWFDSQIEKIKANKKEVESYIEEMKRRLSEL